MNQRSSDIGTPINVAIDSEDWSGKDGSEGRENRLQSRDTATGECPGGMFGSKGEYLGGGGVKLVTL